MASSKAAYIQYSTTSQALLQTCTSELILSSTLYSCSLLRVHLKTIFQVKYAHWLHAALKNICSVSIVLATFQYDAINQANAFSLVEKSTFAGRFLFFHPRTIYYRKRHDKNIPAEQLGHDYALH